MKMPEFNHKQKQWDYFKRFFVSGPAPAYGGWYYRTSLYDVFVEFETGELIFTAGYPHPCDRKTYSQYNLQVIGTTDPDFRRDYRVETPGGEKVPYAWISRYGMERMVIDHDTMRMYQLARYANKLGDQVPAGLQNTARMYWPGPGSDPIAAPVILNRPWHKTKEDKDRIQQIVAACKAWVSLLGLDQLNEYGEDYDKLMKALDIERYSSDVARQYTLSKSIAYSGFKELSKKTKYRIGRHGFTCAFTKEELPYLTIKPKQKGV